MILTSIFFFKRVTKAYEAYQEQEAVLSTTLQENLTGVRVVKAFARQEYERDKFEKDNWEKFLRGRKLIGMHSLFWPVSDIVCGVQMLAGFTGGGHDGDQRRRSPSARTWPMSAWSIWIIWPMRNLGRLIVQTSTGLVSYGRVMEIIKRGARAAGRGQIYPPGEACEGEIGFENVGFEYDAGTPSAAGHQLPLPAGAGRSRCWVRPVPARPPWSTCCRASTNTPAGSSRWMASS